MKYYYNRNYGVILYPENWFDVLRCLLTWFIHPSFIRTWRSNPHWSKAPVVGCLEKDLVETEYPDLGSAS